jgi:hypothetical protein
MKVKLKILAIIAGGVLALAVPVAVFFIRAPVLIVTDIAFTLLYGVDRIRMESILSSLSLFRPVKTVVIADDAADDIVQFVIAEVSSNPYCVIFPLRFAQAARIYRTQNPDIPVIMLEGRYPEGNNPSARILGNQPADFFVYKTDLDADFYRAGVAAAILDRGKNDRIAVFLENHVQTRGREAFLRAMNEQTPPLQAVFYTAFSHFSGTHDFSCVILAGVAAEYLDRYTDIPVIFFTWMNPSFLPVDVVIIFNDSPWVQAVPAVRMVNAGVAAGLIPSRLIFLPGNGIDKEILRKLRKI